MALVTISEVRTHLNIPASDTSHDTELQGFMDAAQVIIENIVGSVVQTTYTETYDGGNSYIEFRHKPVFSITSVSEYQGSTLTAVAVATNPALATTPSYTFDSFMNRVVRRNAGGWESYFPLGANAIAITYVAGLASVPANVRLAALELIRHLYQQTQQGGRPSFGGSGSDETYSPGSGYAVPNRVLELLDATPKLIPGIA